MRTVIVGSIVLLSSSAVLAGSYDDLGGVEVCNTSKAPATVVLPDGSIVAGPATPNSLAQQGQYTSWGDPDDKNQYKQKVPAWCSTDQPFTLDGAQITAVGTAFVAIRWSKGDGMDGDGIEETEAYVGLWSYPMADKDAVAAAKAGTLKAPPAIPAGADAAPDATAVILRASSTKKLAALAKNLLLVGSAPDQRWRDDLAKRQLASWKLDLTVDPTVQSGMNAATHQAWVIANVTAKGKGKKAAPAITYRVLYGLIWKDGKGGKKKWSLALVQFAIVR